MLPSRADESGGSELVLFGDAVAGAEKSNLHGKLLSFSGNVEEGFKFGFIGAINPIMNNE